MPLCIVCGYFHAVTVSSNGQKPYSYKVLNIYSLVLYRKKLATLYQSRNGLQEPLYIDQNFFPRCKVEFQEHIYAINQSCLQVLKQRRVEAHVPQICHPQIGQKLKICESPKAFLFLWLSQDISLSRVIDCPFFCCTVCV